MMREHEVTITMSAETLRRVEAVRDAFEGYWRTGSSTPKALLVMLEIGLQRLESKLEEDREKYDVEEEQSQGD